jgi:hypothetical protein
VIWAVLVLLGVPLWLCAAGILVLVLRNRGLRKRPHDIPMRLRVLPDGRWRRGHGLWAHDVLAFRGSPATWAESLLWVSGATSRELTAEEAHKLRRLDSPMAVTLAVDGKPAAHAVTSRQHLPLLLGPYATGAAPVEPSR